MGNFILKKRELLVIAIMLMVFSFSCKEGEVDPGLSLTFYAGYNPQISGLMGESQKLVTLNFTNGVAEYADLVDLYPPSYNLMGNCDLAHNCFGLGLHSDFNEGFRHSSQGAYLDLNAGQYYMMPLITPEQDDDYPYFEASTCKMSDNGYLFYIAATNDKNYGDEYKAFICRYDPSDNSAVYLQDPTEFALNQPEKKWDTEAGIYQRDFAVSNDGQTVYGTIQAFGVEAGAIHWDYRFLFKYEYGENGGFTRIGDEDDDEVSLGGITDDGRYLLYYSNGLKKLLDLTTNTVSVVDVGSISAPSIQWNNYGACHDATTGIYYKNYVGNEQVKVASVYDADNAQFDLTGQYIYFTLEGTDENYLCRTKGLTEEIGYDTLATYPADFYHLILAR